MPLADLQGPVLERRRHRCVPPIDKTVAAIAATISTISLPAVTNAVADALARAGASSEIDMPLTPEKIWRALRGATHDHKSASGKHGSTS